MRITGSRRKECTMLTPVRRRKLLAAALAGATLAALGVTFASSHAAATGGNPAELLTSAKTLAPLKSGVTYQASSFPLRLRLTVSDSSWLGAQFSATSHGRPAFGWVVLGHPPID